MAVLAALDWNSRIIIVQTPPLFGIAISFIGDRTTREMKAKHAMWALEDMFDIFVETRRYAPGSVVVDITPTRLGVGNVQSAPSIQATTSQTGGLSNAIEPLTDIVLGMNSSLSLNSQGNASATHASLPLNLLSDAIPLNSSRSAGLTLKIDYRPGGVSFDAAQIYNATLKLLIRVAEPTDMEASIGPILSIYNDVENFTISFAPDLYVKSTPLSWVDCIYSINALIVLMWAQGPEGRWAELDGFIRDGAVTIGRSCIDRGDLTSSDPKTVCTKVPLEGASVLRV